MVQGAPWSGEVEGAEGPLIVARREKLLSSAIQRRVVHQPGDELAVGHAGVRRKLRDK